MAADFCLRGEGRLQPHGRRDAPFDVRGEPDKLPWAALSLLTAAFLAATLLPGSSEVLLVALIVHYPDAVGMLVLVAAVGNTGGSLVNCGLGMWLGRPVA